MTLFFQRSVLTCPIPQTIVEMFGTVKMGMQKSISLFNWEKAFENLSINEKVGLLNNTLLNTFCNYIPNKMVKCSYRDPP